MRQSPVRRNDGFSLVEVLVAIVILTIGLFGLAGLQARAHTAEVEAFSRARALMLVNQMADRVAANRADAMAATPTYDTTTIFGVASLNPGTEFGVGAGDDCSDLATTTPDQLAVRDLCEWHEALRGVSASGSETNVGALSGVRGCIDFQPAAGTAPMQYVVSVAWAGRGAFGTPPADRTCGQGAILPEDSRRIVSVVVPFADLDN